MTAALHFRVLEALPAPLAALCRAHAYADELQELVQEAALAMLAAPEDSATAIYNRARSNVRRFSQNPAHYATGGDAIDMLFGDDVLTAGAGFTRRQVRKQIESDLGLNTRAAQRLLRKQLERMRENGDLFAGDGSGVTA